MKAPSRESANMMADAVAEAAHPLGEAAGSALRTLLVSSVVMSSTEDEVILCIQSDAYNAAYEAILAEDKARAYEPILGLDPHDCDTCNGNGILPETGGDSSPCINCNGTGRLKYTEPNAPHEPRTPAPGGSD